MQSTSNTETNFAWWQFFHAFSQEVKHQESQMKHYRVKWAKKDWILWVASGFSRWWSVAPTVDIMKLNKAAVFSYICCASAWRHWEKSGPAQPRAKAKQKSYPSSLGSSTICPSCSHSLVFHVSLCCMSSSQFYIHGIFTAFLCRQTTRNSVMMQKQFTLTWQNVSCTQS